jgi:D-alanyl-D-alanine carboxypeptidase
MFVKALLQFAFRGSKGILSLLVLAFISFNSNAADTANVLPKAIANAQLDPHNLIPYQEHEVKAGLLYDAVNKKIVWQKNMDMQLPIASLTKMMVALLAVEDIRAGKFFWSENVCWVRQTAVGRRSKRRIVRTDVNYTLLDVVKATMIASNNECAEQLARFIGCGDLASTIERMNARAKELGMNNTYYGNPSGLPASHASMDNSSTPLDQLILGLELLKHDELLEITGMGYAEVNNGKSSSVLRNHNGLAIQHTGEVDGLKTGYTRRAGFCLVGTSSKCDHRLVSVVLGCRGPQIRNDVVRTMFNAYYTSIGLDPIGNFCGAPGYRITGSENQDSSFTMAGEWVTIREKVRKTHTVRSGENLSRLAERYDCSMSQLRTWNKGKIPSSDQIKTGQKLSVYTTTTRKVWIARPANGSEEEEDKPLLVNSTIDEQGNLIAAKPVEKPVKPSTAVTVQPNYLYHVVAPGDTLYSIARKYGVTTVDQLKDLNDIRDTRTLKPGMKIKVKVEG